MRERMKDIPHQIEAMREQLGTGLNGGLVYVGASRLTYLCKYESGGAESKVTETGLVDAPVSLAFNVNGKRREGWKVIVSLEPSDTYTVRLWKPSKISLKKQCQLMAENKVVPVGEVIDVACEIYCDQLQSCVEQMYDRAIRERNDGFIPLD